MIFRTLLRRLYIQPAGYPAHYQSRRERFSTLPPSSMYHVFLSINAPPPGTDSWHVWRDTSRLMIFLFPSNTRSLFPLILLLLLSLSLSLSLYIYTSFPHLFANRWKPLTGSRQNRLLLMASFPYDVRRETPSFVWRYHLRFIFTLPPDSISGWFWWIGWRLVGIRKQLEILFLIGGISDWEAVLFRERRSKLFK